MNINNSNAHFWRLVIAVAATCCVFLTDVVESRSDIFDSVVEETCTNDPICGQTLSKNYKLTQDYDCTGYVSGPTVTNGATLNCDGFTISGATGFGIILQDDESTVKNCIVDTITGSEGIGIYMKSSGTKLQNV